MAFLRLLADDLTGALDTAAEFVPLTGELPVIWHDHGRLAPTESAALDSGTRECDPATAAGRVERLVGHLSGADIAFKKIDSLLRGPTLMEIAACLRSGIWRYCALAPAFPYQGRFTRAGRQYAGTEPITGDLVAALRAIGLTAQSGPELKPGITVFDAETDDDLRRIVTTVRDCSEPVLWIGTGGLAQALAADQSPRTRAPLARPILGLFGSDQPATAAQLVACEPHWLDIADDDFAPVPARLNETGIVLVSFRLPPDTERMMAAARIAGAIQRLSEHVRPPGTIVVAGGETLRSVCDAVGAESLLVTGRLVPGVPCSTIVGGRWNGVTVVSKSGAFGHKLLLRDLILERTI
ncbi:MAG TPA: Hrp-dependent type III effector protein [Acetobacteraceae bacterium]|nr:Hrp-dependent type III effector protein [Acetobacteraceae bacterium]